MSMVIANNISAINTKRNFASSAKGMSGAMERLSSGYKINTGKDDPSGLLISEKLRSQINGIKRAQQNTEEAINVMGIAEGAMNEMNSILKKMKALAIHSNSTGVVTPDQIAADQSELDSAIQTLDRIAQTTKFSGEALTNGKKDLDFDAKTNVKGTQQNALINSRETEFSQIFKRDGYKVNISFTGSEGTIAAGGTHAGTKLTGDGKEVNFANQAAKAYLELDTNSTAGAGAGQPKAQVTDGLFTQDQSFTLTGSTGSRSFTFSKGDKVTDMVQQIQSASDTTGVNASLIFNSAQQITSLAAAGNSATAATAYASGNQAIFNSKTNGQGTVTAGATDVELKGAVWGKNTDGQGNVYIKYVDNNTVELYKDSSLSKESLVAGGTIDGATGEVTLTERNNSGLTGDLTVEVSANLADVKGNYINTGGITANAGNGVAWSGNLAIGGGTNKMFNGTNSLLTGVKLGQNTSADGQIFFKTVSDGTNMQIFAYKDERMRDEDLVAQSDNIDTATGVTWTLNEVRNSDNTAGTGLSIVLSRDAAGALDAGTETSNLTFENLGARVYANDYGSDQMLKITQDKGALFTYFGTKGDNTRTLIDAGEDGTTYQNYGQDATLSVNGKQVKTNGLTLNMATQDIQANFTFNAGKVGSTTLAQVGYGEGSAFTQAGALNLAANNQANTNTGGQNGLSAYLCNAGHSTSQTVGDFQGGMQLQIGEGSGDDNRTVVAIKSLTSENLGRVKQGGYYDSANPTVYTEKYLSMKDVFGGGEASLKQNAVLAMKIIDVAISDVSETRAKVGAMQTNLLQTNSNNLAVTMENIQKTESGIRDADMADEMTDFTKQQVLQNAAMSMMGQANSSAQNVLQLLR